MYYVYIYIYKYVYICNVYKYIYIYIHLYIYIIGFRVSILLGPTEIANLTTLNPASPGKTRPVWKDMVAQDSGHCF